MSDRFQRVRMLLGEALMDRLTASHVAVFGLGAVGCFTAELLARSGIGQFTLVDFDTITPTNTNRLLTAVVSSLGQNKAQAAAERILSINPDAEAAALPLFLDGDTVPRLLDENTFDLVFDCIDSLNPKLALLEEALRRGTPILSSMGAASRRQASLARSGDLWQTHGCPLAAAVRRGLRRRGRKEKLTVVWSPEPPRKPFPPETLTSAERSPYQDRGRPRNVQSSMAHVPAAFAALLVELALERLAENS